MSFCASQEDRTYPVSRKVRFVEFILHVVPRVGTNAQSLEKRPLDLRLVTHRGGEADLTTQRSASPVLGILCGCVVLHFRKRFYCVRIIAADAG